jgi:hypothetical protein
METPELFHETAQGQEPDGERPEYGDPEDGGDLLTMDEAKVGPYLVYRWDSQTSILRPLINQWTVNALRRKGIPGVRMKGGEESAVRVPKGAAASADVVPSLNKQADTIRRLGGLLFSDPPATEAVPPSDSEEDKDASEFSTQVLEEVDGESELDDVRNAELAFDRGADYGSGFVFYYTDKTGGSRVPVQVQAGFDPTTGEQAGHVDHAVYRPEHLEVGMKVEWRDYKKRYVQHDGTLTDEQAHAATTWAPKLRAKVLRSTNVRFLPFNARDIWDADGVILTDFPTWEEAQHDHPELKELGKEDRDAVFSAKPKDWKDIMTASERRAVNAKAKEDRPVWRMRCYYRACPAYPKGAEVIVIGGKHVLPRNPWVLERPDGTQEALDIPLTQYAQLDEGGRGGPYTVGMSEILGGANEMRTYIWSMVVHQLERVRNQKVLLPSLGKIHAKMLQRPGKNVLPFAPGYEPKYEQIPDLPSVVMEAFERISLEMDDASGVQAAARGMETPNVGSARHHYAIMGQVKQGLASLIRNIERGWVRGGRIKLQLIRKDYTTEQQLLWSGDDDEWKQKAWRRADLGSTRDVRLKTGTLTMYSPAQKEALAFEWHGAGMIDDQRLYEIVATGMGGTIGIQQDNRRSRIKRQLNRWSDGPPPEWVAPQPKQQPRLQPATQPDPMTGAAVPVVDPATGQPAMAPATDEIGQPIMDPVLDASGRPTFEPDPVLDKIFEAVPADLVPKTAQMRFDMISDVMNGKKYLDMPAAWRAALDAEWYRMQQAIAAVPPQQPGRAAPPQATAKAPGYTDTAVAGPQAA